jgi:hypothetical protein|tara:strand:+ start:11596 stop:12177 length:582 start_codon:yes stop_codon:yes gene_type:complete
MSNLIIKNTQDFNNQLMKMLCEEDVEEEKECLITGEKLESNYVKLACTHTFNYTPLINEIKNQKTHSNLEVTSLKTYEVKCPYCRGIQKGVIKFDEEFAEKIQGVNWPPSKMYKGNICTAVFKSGKRKNETCGKACVDTYCTRHTKFKNNITCKQLLKSGQRKGEMCGCNCVGVENKELFKCGRHLKVKTSKK